jgi:mannose-6-phosphate isomerase-like protein (cupin superfamily)
MSGQYSLQDALARAEAAPDTEYGVLLKNGSMELGMYRPVGIDRQTPHAQDEIYVVQSGSGYFVNGDCRSAFSTGGALFVPAGVAHRFEEFSDDFAAWVIFYGPDGGE